MSISHGAMLAYGWIIEDDELDNIPDEIYEELINRDVIIFQNDVYATGTMIFALDYYLSTDEDSIIEINKPLCRQSEDLVNLFYRLFPKRANEEPKYFLCVKTS